MSKQDDKSCGAKSDPPSKSINIRGVPHDVWLHARQMALRSGLPFGEYCITCLQDGGVYPAEESSPTLKSHVVT